MQAMVDQVQSINLDNNKIGGIGLNSLITWIDTQANKSQLEVLSLENNNFGDAFAVDLC